MAMLHQMLEHLVYGIGVEEPAVDGLRVDLSWRAAAIGVITPVCVLPLFLFFVAEPVVVDAVARKLKINLLHTRRYKEAVGDCRRQLIRVSRYAWLQSKEGVCVSIDLISRRGGQSNEQRVEVSEDRAELLVHRPVGLVDNHEIEVARAESGFIAIGLVDQAHHGWIGRHVHAALGVFLGDQIDWARCGQVLLEGIDGLPHKGLAIGQKEHALDPASLLQ